MANIFIILLECFMLKNIFTPIKEKRKSKGYIAGYILNAAINSPLNKKTTDRCKPQPKHSKSNSCLLKHGNI